MSYLPIVFFEFVDIENGINHLRLDCIQGYSLQRTYRDDVMYTCIEINGRQILAGEEVYERLKKEFMDFKREADRFIEKQVALMSRQSDLAFRDTFSQRW